MIGTELTLPNDARVLHLARAYVRELATLADLPSDQVEVLVLAADEACTNVVEHAFEPGESGTFTVSGKLTPIALTLSIYDRGMPFDESLAPTYTTPEGEDVTQVNAQGLGLHLIQQAVDEAHWINHGREGKELRLIKYRPQPDVTAQLPETELIPFRDDEPQAPAQNYTIWRLRPEDAVWVARCIYCTYGYTYPNDDLYYPECIAHLNETGELISAVAVDEAGKVVGHCALERPDLGPVAEIGQAMVVPAHRERGLVQHMGSFLEDEAHRLELLGIFAQPVTTHVFSQRAAEHFGYRVCGLSLGTAPRSVHFRKIQTEPLPQRESCMLYFKYLVPPLTAVVHAPTHHRKMLERIYNHLGTPVEFRRNFQSPIPNLQPDGQVTVYFNQPLGLGIIRVRHVGADSAVEIRRARRDLCDIAGAEVVYLELPLAQAGTPALCQAVEEEGFFFSGLGPHFAPDGDALRLQYLNVELDTVRLQVMSPLGQELVEYMTRERKG
jgi:anti-sigma regulatory factor (Ser/Thr protein kinase)